MDISIQGTASLRREEAHRDLMRLLALSGERRAALAQHETCRAALAAELGVEPAPGFVGRTAELAHISRLLADPACRLVTLVGPRRYVSCSAGCH